MRASNRVSTFVRDALIAGRTRNEIAHAMETAGWSESEIRAAIGEWAEVEFDPPVPRPLGYVSAREAFGYGLMFSALAMTAWHLTALSFGLIDLWLPDPVSPQNASRQMEDIRWSVSSLIVFAPLFVLLNLHAQKAVRSDPGKRRSAVRKWVGYIILFLASISLLGDLIWVIYALLNGELTARVLAKAVVVAVVAGGVFGFFRQETRDDDHAA